MRSNLIILAVLAIVAIGTIPALAEYPSPLKQIQMGTEPDDILCNADRVHVIRDNGNHVCVTEATAHRTGWIVLADDAARTEPPDERGILQVPARTITVTPQLDTGVQYSSEPIHGPYFPNYTTYTYPEQITIGVPFTINYTYTYEGSRLSVPEVLPDGTVWPTYVELAMKKEIALHTDGFEAKPETLEYYDVATMEEYMQKAPYGQYYLTKPVPFNNTGIQSGSITLQVDGKDGKEYHGMYIRIDEYPAQRFFIYVDGQTGHIRTEKETMVFPSDHIKYLEKLGVTASEQQVVDSLGGVAGSSTLPDYESPFSERCTESIGDWDSLDADAKLWHIMYYECPSWYPAEPLPPEILQEIEEKTARGEYVLEYIRAFNITSDFRAHLEEVKDDHGFFTQEEIDAFFRNYPEFETQSLDPSHFLLTSDIDQIGGRIFVSGKAYLDGSNNVPPKGFEICVFDQRNNGNYDVLKFQREDACEIADDQYYAIPATNIDPDDQTGVDVVVGIRSGNDIIKIVDQNEDIHVYHGNHVIRDAEQLIVDYPDITVPNNDAVTGALPHTRYSNGDLTMSQTSTRTISTL